MANSDSSESKGSLLRTGISFADVVQGREPSPTQAATDHGCKVERISTDEPSSSSGDVAIVNESVSASFSQENISAPGPKPYSEATLTHIQDVSFSSDMPSLRVGLNAIFPATAYGVLEKFSYLQATATDHRSVPGADAKPHATSARDPAVAIEDADIVAGPSQSTRHHKHCQNLTSYFASSLQAASSWDDQTKDTLDRLAAAVDQFVKDEFAQIDVHKRNTHARVTLIRAMQSVVNQVLDENVREHCEGQMGTAFAAPARAAQNSAADPTFGPTGGASTSDAGVMPRDWLSYI